MTTPTPTPSIGRIVHYMARGSADGVFPPTCRAAVITDLDKTVLDLEYVSLCVLNPSGIFFDQQIAHDEDRKTPGSWHWPERV